jgi:translation initiation factor 2 alpha subunit (eIF-2alpha)
MNYNNISNDWDQQLRDAMMDMPAPTDEEVEMMIEELRQQYGDDYDEFDSEVQFRGIKHNFAE